MFILQTISSIDIESGGPTRSITNLCKELAYNKNSIALLTHKSNTPIVSEKDNLNYDLRFNSHGYFSFKKLLNNFTSSTKVDIMHGHGIWQMPVHQMAQIAHEKHIPYIISPRGMLEPWALNTEKWKKKLALKLYQYNDLANTYCIHATSEMEADNVRKLGFKNPIAVIPNGIDLSEFPLQDTKQPKEKRTMLFLSRVHPKKGLELLIEAWARLDKSLRQDWKVDIVGNGAAAYIASLQHLIEKKGLQSEIRIIGPLFDADKLKTYQQADLFVLPTYSENFGIVVVEALACGVPVITTIGTPWKQLNTSNVGWWINIGVAPLVQCLQKALQLTDSERQRMGENGRKLVEEYYSIESVARKMIQLYEWILKEGEKPEFVYM